MPQESCTEIINSAVADVADMVAIDGNPNKRCPVLCSLSRVPHNKSVPVLGGLTHFVFRERLEPHVYIYFLFSMGITTLNLGCGSSLGSKLI